MTSAFIDCVFYYTSVSAELVYAANDTFQLNTDHSNVDEADFRPVPLSQLYNHHYAAYNLASIVEYATDRDAFQTKVCMAWHGMVSYDTT